MNIVYNHDITPKPLDKLPQEELTTDNDNPVIASSSGGDTVNHNNYLEYLQCAWAKHLGVVVDPTFFWHMILSEVAALIKGNPDRYRDLFTTEDDKQEIVGVNNNPVVLPVDLIVAKLEQLIPTDTALFFPDFSTKTPQYTLASQITFCDAVSPFFSYSMMMCGIPSYDVRGEDTDWELLHSQSVKLHELLGLDNTSLHETLEGLTHKANRDDVLWWTSMFRLDRCGSGHQVEVGGWITNMYNVTPRVRYVGNFSSHIGTISYINLDTNKEYNMYSGLFHSTYVDGTLIPDFGWQVKEALD